jgi:transcription initiation factor TFIID subunit 2
MIDGEEGLMDRIPEEDARDLSLIKSNFDKGRYTTYKQVDDDFALMLENARVFNGEGEITDTANKFGRWWDAQRRKMD